MSGIYIHIPFCKSRCIYCDFYKETNEEHIDIFVSNLCKEINLRQQEANYPIETIYFGGGTPSRLNKNQLTKIFQSLFNNLNILKDSEITIEANPDDLNTEYISTLKNLPFNRLSIGIQSFNDKELKFLNRRHNSAQVIDAINNCKNAGFDNISIDLIYGLPNQNIDTWKQNIAKAINLNIEHISAYHLIYEKTTKLYNMLNNGIINTVSDETSTTMFSILIDTLSKNNFEQYEISNFAKNNMYSKHNSSYWNGKKYIGFGPSAHSYDLKNRYWNISSLTKYIKAISNNKPLIEKEILSDRDKYNELILTKLRTKWGIKTKEILNEFGNKYLDYFSKNSEKYLQSGHLTIENDTIIISKKGIFISDGIMSDLMCIKSI